MKSLNRISDAACCGPYGALLRRGDAHDAKDDAQLWVDDKLQPARSFLQSSEVRAHLRLPAGGDFIRAGVTGHFPSNDGIIQTFRSTLTAGTGATRSVRLRVTK